MGSWAPRGYGPGHAPAGRRTDPPGVGRAARGHPRARPALLPGGQGVGPALRRAERRRRGRAGRRAGDPAPAPGAVRADRLHRSRAHQRARRDREDARVRAPEPRRARQAGAQHCWPSTSRRGWSASASWARTPSPRSGRTSRRPPRRARRCRSRTLLARRSGPRLARAPAGRRARRRHPEGHRRGVEGAEAQDRPGAARLPGRDRARPPARRARASWCGRTTIPRSAATPGHDDKPPAATTTPATTWARSTSTTAPRATTCPWRSPRVEPLLGPLHELGYSTIWQEAGHYNHLHVDIGGSGGAVDLGPGGGRRLRLRRPARPHRARDQARRLGEAGRDARRPGRQLSSTTQRRSAVRPTRRSCC